VCRSKHVEPSINFGIINSITKMHLFGISTETIPVQAWAGSEGSRRLRLPDVNTIGT
jgi:hypothetical protein